MFHKKNFYFCTKHKWMKKALILFYFLIFSTELFAQNEIGPEGRKLFLIMAILIGMLFVLFVLLKPKRKLKSVKRYIFRRKKVRLEITKDRMYYPDYLDLTIKNTGNTDVDIDQPLIVFDNFWLKRKFKLKGTNHYRFYPLYLEKGKTHSLKIDINRFYKHDNRLKKFPKMRFVITEINGKRLATGSVFLRKTLLKF